MRESREQQFFLPINLQNIGTFITGFCRPNNIKGAFSAFYNCVITFEV